MSQSVPVILIVGLAVSSACLADDAQYGSISGRIRFSGEVPILMPLVSQGSAVKDADVCSAATIPNERLVVDPATGGVSNIFVWFEKIDLKTVHPELSQRSLEPVKMIFEGCRIQPHAICVETRADLRVMSYDRVAHNPHDYPRKNSVGCVALVPGLRDDPGGFIHSFAIPESPPIRFTCDYHPWINAFVLVQDHPYMTVSAIDGSFEIPKVPFGKHRFRMWHEDAGYLMRQDVEIDKEEVRLGVIDFKMTPEHLEKLSVHVHKTSESVRAPSVGSTKEN